MIPVGHVTELIMELGRWAEARERKQLDATPLRRAITYLEELRRESYGLEEWCDNENCPCYQAGLSHGSEPPLCREGR